MTDRDKIMDKYWNNFLEWVRDNKELPEVQALVATKPMEDIFWIWYTDNELGGIKQ